MIQKLTKLTARMLATLFAVFATSGAWAAVPTVAWDGDFGTTEKTGSDGVTYTFAAGTGNSVENGKLVIGSGSGYGGAITWSRDTTKGVVSVLIKYSSLDTTDKGTPALAAVASMQCNDDGTPKGTIIDDCVCVKDANGSKLTGRYNSVSTAYGGEVADIKSPSGYLLMVYKSGAEFQFWTSADGLNWSGGTASGLKFSNTFPQGLGLGGMSGSASASGHVRTAGMTIEAVAIYRGVELNAAKARNCHFDSEYTTQDYKKWAYANSVVSFNSASNSDIGSSGTKVKDFNIASGSNRGDDYGCGGGTTYFGTTFWHPFCCNQSAYSAPGCVLRVATVVNVKAGFSYSQGPLTLGGLIIESAANGCSFSGDEQSTVLGSAKDSCETWFSIKGNAAINRNGFMFISGNVNIDVVEGKSFSLNASQSTSDYYPTIKGTVTTANTATGAGTAGGVLRMHGLGTITVPTLIASNSATLDFSDVQGNATVDRSETPFIQGNLTVDATTKLVLPAGIADGEEYKICSGTLTAPTKTVQTSVQIGSGDAFTAYVTYSASNKTVSYSTTAPTYTGTVDGSTITWDVTPTSEDIANGNIVLTGSGEVTLGAEPISITAAFGVTVDVSGYEAAVLSGAGRFKFSSAYRAQIPSGMTYQYIGSNDQNNPAAISAITVNGTLETTGYFMLSGSNKIATTGELHVLGGKTTMTTGSDDQGICGTLTIDPGATFENGTTDGLHYSGSPTINVYGTLDMASTRWTLGGAILNFYAGSTITGNGTEAHGALDTNDSSKPFNILARAGQDTVNLSARLRPRAQQTFNIADGVTVNCTGTVSDKYEQINITGNGKFKIATGASFPSNLPFNIASSATLELAGGTIAGAIQGTGNLSVASGTYEPSFSSFTGPISVSGSGTVLTLASSQITASSAITVGTGSTLKIKVTDEVIATGFDASSKVSNSGGTVMFVNSSGTQITENVSQDGETLSPAVKVLYWDGTSWSEDDDFTGYTEASIAVSGEASVTLPASLTLQKMTLTGSSGSLTIVGNNNTLTVGDVIIPNGVTLVASSALTVNGSISGGGNLTVPDGVTFTCAEGTTWTIGNSANANNINTGVLTVQSGGRLIVNGRINIENMYDVTASVETVIVENGGTLEVTSTGNLYQYSNYWSMFRIRGECIVAGSLSNYGDLSVESTGALSVSGAQSFSNVYDVIDKGTITFDGRIKYLTTTGYKIKVTDSGKIVFVPTDSYIGFSISDWMTNGVDFGTTTPTMYFDATNLGTKPTGTSATTLVTTSTSLTLGADSLTGCSTDYYVKQDATTGAVTLQLHAAKDSAGVYYDNIEDAFDAIVADHTLAVTILDGTEASYTETLATKGLGRNGTQVFHLVAERRALDGSVIAQYPTAQAAVEADSGDSIVAIYETSTVTVRVAPFYIKPVGISLDDITINCVYAGFTYDEFTDLSGYGGNFVGVYAVQRHASPATFTWNPEVDEGDWNTVANWTSDDGEVLSAPNNSNYTVILGTAASINTGTTTLTLGKMEVGAAVSITGQNQSPREFSFAEGIVFTSESSRITLLYSYFADDTVMSTTVPGKYVRFRMPDDYKYYELVAAKAMVYDSEDNVINGYNTLADAVTAAADGQKVRLFANSSDAITLNGKSITLIEGDYTFSGTFTGNGTLVLPEGTLLKSATAATWGEGWTGTVWLRNYTSLTGSSKQGSQSYVSTSFEPNDYGNSNSTVRFTGVKGYLTANDDGSYTIQPALELVDDGVTPGLLLYNGWGYNANANCRTVIRELKGSGTLAADTTLIDGRIPGLNVLLQVRKWDNFTGTLNMPNKNIVFGSTLPAQSVVEGGGHIAVQSGASVEVPAGKTWTVGSGVVVYGNLSLGTGAAIVNTTVANTWIKCGTGKVTLNALGDLPATPASTWQGTIVLPAVSDVGENGFDFSTYGVDGSTIEIANGFTGWLKRDTASVQPAANFNITSAFTITGTSAETYVLKKLSGTGDFTINDIRNANSFTISLVVGFSGSIVNTLGTDEKKIVITRLNIDSDPTMATETKILDSTTADKISVQSVYYNDASVNLSGALSIVNKADGIYIVRAGTIFSVY